jgi:hypothetical protein
MQNPVPRHIQETESDRRAIKDGWYATNEHGQLCSGRFSNRDDCQAQINREQKDTDAYHGGAAGDN